MIGIISYILAGAFTVGMLNYDGDFIDAGDPFKFFRLPFCFLFWPIAVAYYVAKLIAYHIIG